jgi:hypothetical protein
MGVEADEDRRQTDKAVHRGHKLRHLGHLDLLRHIPADHAADGDHDQRDEPVARAGAVERGRHGQAMPTIPYQTARLALS